MDFDAIVLAGGRGSRTGGVAKVLGTKEGVTLLRRALAACAGARHVVVVGPAELEPYVGDAVLVREDPPFGGPVAALAAGCTAIPDPAPWTLVLAADHVDPAAAVAEVLTSADDDGAIANDGERMQYLLAVYRSSSVRSALAALPGVDGASVRTLIRGLTLHPVLVPPGSARDVDTVEDARALGVTLPRAH